YIKRIENFYALFCFQVSVNLLNGDALNKAESSINFFAGNNLGSSRCSCFHILSKIFFISSEV
ncbi:hypothetical protein, partial [Ligilactobacillus agilis]